MVCTTAHSPRDGIWQPASPALFVDGLDDVVNVDPSLSASPVFILLFLKRSKCGTGHRPVWSLDTLRLEAQATHYGYRIERWDYSCALALLTNEVSVNLQGLLQRASFELGEHLSMQPSSKSGSQGQVANLLGLTFRYPLAKLMRLGLLGPATPIVSTSACRC